MDDDLKTLKACYDEEDNLEAVEPYYEEDDDLESYDPYYEEDDDFDTSEEYYREVSVNGSLITTTTTFEEASCAPTILRECIPSIAAGSSKENSTVPRSSLEMRIIPGDNSEIFTKETISEDNMLHFLLEVKRTWNAVHTFTGFEFGVIPPMCLPPKPEAGHWIKLSREGIPFVYVTSAQEIIKDDMMIQDGPNDIRNNVYTSSLLITKYIRCVIKQMEMVEEDEHVRFKEMLKTLDSVLQSFLTDVDTVMITKVTQDFSLTISKIRDITNKIDQIAPSHQISRQSRNRMVTVTESELLCSIVGLDANLTKNINGLNGESSLHISPFCGIKKIMEHTLLNQTHGSESDLKSNLLFIGLSQVKFQERANQISYRKHDLYSSIYMATKYLEYVFSIHPLLSMLSFFARYANEDVNQWFDAEAEQDVAGNGNAIKIHFKMIHVESVGDNLDVTSSLINDMFEIDGHTLLFHGTKQACSLDLILRRGILLSYGARKQDFSHGGGFFCQITLKLPRSLPSEREIVPTPSSCIESQTISSLSEKRLV